MMNVLAIAPYAFLPFYSGGQKFIARFFEHLGAERALTVVSVPENDKTLAKNFSVIPLLKSSFTRYIDRSLVGKITRLVQEKKIDTLICEHPYFAWLCFAVKKRTGVKVVLHTHNIEYQRFRSMGKVWWPVLKSYEKKSFQKADYIFFISPEDRQFATRNWSIDARKCVDVPFGIDTASFPADRATCREEIAQRHNIAPREQLFTFNGLLDYQPNIDALNYILESINPLLLQQTGLRYKIIISGKNLPSRFNELRDYSDRNIIFTGFADDITLYLKATDIFLNPVLSGGGIKTKVVEAIGYGATVVSTVTGAIGMEKSRCGEKLAEVADHDWQGFVNAIVQTGSQPVAETPASYYEHYYWGNLIRRVISV